MNRAATLLVLLLLAAAPPARAQSAAGPALRASTCTVESLGSALRRGRGSPSAAYKRYLRELAKESAVTLPAAELQEAFWRERDGGLLRQLAQVALVGR